MPSLSVADTDGIEKPPALKNSNRVTLNGHTYQLVIEGGTKLKVYELKGDALQ